MSDVRGPAGRVLCRHPGSVLGGRAQGRDELLPGPVIATFSAGTDFVTPKYQIINIAYCLVVLHSVLVVWSLH